uniref:Uncharacterized protein n=1 Tax=Anopheles atroparvus TaxID=41427 RepID=A0A182J7Y3_ANOAO
MAAKRLRGTLRWPQQLAEVERSKVRVGIAVLLEDDGLLDRVERVERVLAATSAAQAGAVGAVRVPVIPTTRPVRGQKLAAIASPLPLMVQRSLDVDVQLGLGSLLTRATPTEPEHAQTRRRR